MLLRNLKTIQKVLIEKLSILLNFLETEHTNMFFTDKNGEAQQKTTWHECKRFVREVNSSFVEKLSKGTSLVVAGSLRYEEYAKEITKTKSVNIKRVYIDVKEITLT